MSDTVELINLFRPNATFFKHLRKQLSSKKAGMLDSFPDSNFFPNVSQLKAIIETLMWASVQYEEGRLTRLRVGFSEPTPFEHLGLVFRHSKELNAEELRRLSSGRSSARWPDRCMAVTTWQKASGLGITNQ